MTSLDKGDILIVDGNPEELKTLRTILAQEGYHVRTATNGDLALGSAPRGIAHDFNNILSPVMGYAEMLCDDLPDGTVQKEMAESILDGTQRARELVKQLLALGREIPLSGARKKSPRPGHIPAEGTPGPAAAMAPPPDTKALAALSPDLLSELDKGVEILDTDAIGNVISRIEIQDPEIAAHLQYLVDNFRFEILSALIKEITG